MKKNNTSILLVRVKSPNYPLTTTPLGIITLGGYIKNNYRNVIVDYLDFQQEPTTTVLMNQIIKNEYSIIGLSINIGGERELFRILDRLSNKRVFKDSIIIIGNTLSTFAHEEILKKYPFLLCCIGRGEITIQRLIDGVRLEQVNFKDVPNIAYNDSKIPGKIQYSESEYFPLTEEYIPDWNGFFERYPSSLYQEFWIETSSGCGYREKVGCSFCAISPNGNSTKWSRKNIKTISTEIEILKDHGVKHIRFADENFYGGNYEELETLCYQIKDSLSNSMKAKDNIRNVSFDLALRSNNVVEIWKRGSVFQLLSEIGLNQVYIGIESGNDDQLKRLRKGVSVKTNTHAINILRKNKIQIAAGWIMFDPLQENILELKANLDFIINQKLFPRKMGDDFVTSILNRVRIIKGSGFYKDLIGRGQKLSLSPDLVSYNYEISSEIMRKIFVAINSWKKGISPLTYALKNFIALSDLNRDYSSEILNVSHYFFYLKYLDFLFIKSLISKLQSYNSTQDDIFRLIKKMKYFRSVCVKNLKNKVNQYQIPEIEILNRRIRNMN